MNKRRMTFLALWLLLGLAGCDNNLNTQSNLADKLQTKQDPVSPGINNAVNSALWQGSYYGTLPCADCSGIKTELTLTGNRFTLTSVYLDTDTQPDIETGLFSINKTNNHIKLSNGYLYLWQQDKLYMLDADGNRATGALASFYTLSRK